MSRKPMQNMDLRLRAAVESSPSGLLMIDAEGMIVLVNREVERLFGYTREELLGRSVELLVPERFADQHSGFRAGFLTNPRVREMGAGRDLYGRRKDGTEVPVEIGLTPVATEDGLYVLSSIVDISARKRAEKRFRVAVEASPNGMVMVDAAGRIVLVNKEVERLFGYERAELLGRNIDLLVPERFRTRHPDFRADFFAAPRSRSMGAGRELYGLRKDGTEVPVEIGLNPIDTEDGLFVLSSIVDISARLSADLERQRLEKELRQAQKLEAVGRLAGGIAHEFNNVLGAIVGLAELARESPNEESRDADLNQLLVAAMRGKALIERILRFSRRQEVTCKLVDLSQLLTELVRPLRAALPATIEIRVDAGVRPMRVLADVTSVQQVLMNLAVNAAHAMANGGLLELSLGTRIVDEAFTRSHPGLRTGPFIELIVRDHGAGMDEATRTKALEPFFTTKPSGQGTGLGLTIVHGLMRDHNGALDLESEPGKGTTVHCLFPAILTDEETGAAESPSAVPTGKGERILYIDDEVALAVVAKRLLERAGYVVGTGSDPVAALLQLRADPAAFDLIITDYAMPNLNGIELAREIHRLRPELPILLVTGYIDELSEAELQAAGLRTLLKKPVSRDVLCRTVHALLGKAPFPPEASVRRPS